MIGKFFIVGAISTAVDYLIYSLLIYGGLPYYLSIVIGYMTGLLVNFYLVRERVFTRGSRFEKVHHEFIAVTIASLLGLGLNIFIVWALSHWAEIDYYTSRLIAIGVVFFFNYYVRKGWIYAV
ncbi:MAG: hypothetical protein C6I05_00110 [Epsilonproteobacteria bacterium]|nr:hypothetical protein [Campylobacterota bacterium]